MGIYTTQLALVRKAIKDILITGQDVSYKGRHLGMADLATLRQLEKDYEAAAAQETSPTRGRNRVSYIEPAT